MSASSSAMAPADLSRTDLSLMAEISDVDIGAEAAAAGSLGDLTVLMDDAAGASQDEVLLSFVSLNHKTAKSCDLIRGALAVLADLPRHVAPSSVKTLRLSCGRDVTNGIVVGDNRVSQIHFTLRVRVSKAGLIAIELLDHSSNGTWVNGKLVGNTRRVPLMLGDRVIVLPGDSVGYDAEIGFILLQDARGARCRRPGAQNFGPAPRVPAATASQEPVLSRALERELRCGVCTDALHHCLALVPCGHNFCTPCLLRWHRSSPLCPECRTPVQQAVKNIAIDRVVETYLLAQPEGARSQKELSQLEAEERDPEQQVLLKWLLRTSPVQAPKNFRAISQVATPLRAHQHREASPAAQAAAPRTRPRPSAACCIS